MSKTNLPIAERRFVENRAKGYCEYCLCHKDFATDSFCMEHISPLADEGSNDTDNLAFACGSCNGHKHAKMQGTDPDSGEITVLFNPRFDLWNDHFEWDAPATLILGKTPIGRVTIETLKMNRSPVINIRKGMIAIGIHPPKFQ